MVTLETLLDRGEARERARDAARDAQRAAGAGLYWVGWLLAKLGIFLMLAVAAPFVAAGWLGSRVAWPAARWTAAAFMVGWEAGKSGGPAR